MVMSALPLKADMCGAAYDPKRTWGFETQFNRQIDGMRHGIGPRSNSAKATAGVQSNKSGRVIGVRNGKAGQ